MTERLRLIAMCGLTCMYSIVWNGENCLEANYQFLTKSSEELVYHEIKMGYYVSLEAVVIGDEVFVSGDVLYISDRNDVNFVSYNKTNQFSEKLVSITGCWQLSESNLVVSFDNQKIVFRLAIEDSIERLTVEEIHGDGLFDLSVGHRFSRFPSLFEGDAEDDMGRRDAKDDMG